MERLGVKLDERIKDLDLFKGTSEILQIEKKELSKLYKEFNGNNNR